VILTGATGVGAAPATLPSGDGPWTGTVRTIGAPRAGEQSAVVALDAPPGIEIAATLPVYPAVVPGDRLTLAGGIKPAPTDGGYGSYLARIGVAGTLRASTVTVATAPGDLGRGLEGLRRGADDAISRAIPEPEAGLASGILVGLRDRVDRDLTAAFTAVGATHIVAISGWNIAIVASTVAALAGRVARRRRIALTAMAILAYVAFVGPSPSVVRAAAMAGVVMAARELGRPSRAAAAIGWAVAGLLVVDPSLIDDVGFRLSAVATAGLIAWGTGLTDRLAGQAPGRVRAWLAESLGISLAAQLATLPIVVLSFGRLSIVSPLMNLGVVPLVAPAMAAGAVALVGGALVLAGFPGVVATVLGLPAWLLFSAIVGLVRVGASLPFASVMLGSPWDVAVAAAAGSAIVSMPAILRARPERSAGLGTAGHSGSVSQRPDGSRQRLLPWWRGRPARWLAGVLMAATLGLAIVVVHRPDGTPRVTVLDVGQGDAILVEGDRGSRLLVDGGPDPGRLLIALDEHLPPWDRRIDLVILSHPHEDHAAGLAALLGRYAVRRVLEPGMFGPGPGYAALNAELIARGIGRGTLATGDRLAVDDVRFDVLWPDPGFVPARPADDGTGINNVSIVLLGAVGRHRLLLAGDIEQQIDPRLLARGLPRVDLLKVAHHGSRTSSTEAFLEAVRPAVAVISAGRGNPYGHPAPATVTRLEDSGARVLRTDDDGTVTIDLGPGPLRVHATGGRPTAVVARGAIALLCGIQPRRPPTILDGAAPPPPSRIVPVAAAAPASAAPVASSRPFHTPGLDPARLGYDPVRDHPELGSPVGPACPPDPAPPGRRLLRPARRLRHRR
jgi:competence protein ComEC